MFAYKPRGCKSAIKHVLRPPPPLCTSSPSRGAQSIGRTPAKATSLLGFQRTPRPAHSLASP